MCLYECVRVRVCVFVCVWDSACVSFMVFVCLSVCVRGCVCMCLCVFGAQNSPGQPAEGERSGIGKGDISKIHVF